mmetsp:Transcript_63445/g.138156  ORF Transcript_63445/g.138156 Transcript_63445/m.138156 type:complete len:339 (+) Transcript_63445:70-1086(+)
MLEALPGSRRCHRKCAAATAVAFVGVALARAQSRATPASFCGLNVRVAAALQQRSQAVQRHATYNMDSSISPTAPFLTLTETKPRQERKLSAKKRRQAEKLAAARVMPAPAEDAEELVQQLRDMEKSPLRGLEHLQHMLSFLDQALRTSAFSAAAAACAVCVLATRQPGRRSSQEIVELQGSLVPGGLANRGSDLLGAADASGSSIGASLAANALFSVASCKGEIPQLLALAMPLALHAKRAGLDEMRPRDVAYLLWATAQLREDVPELQAELLPMLIVERKVQGLKKSMAPDLHARVNSALSELRKDPFLRDEVLPGLRGGRPIGMSTAGGKWPNYL